MASQAERKRFGSYISMLRQKQGFQQEQACEGLCTKQLLSYYENGQRTTSWLLQSALLERLGVGAEDYEHYLGYIDYDHWEARQRILYCITYGETNRATQLLEEYRTTYIKHFGGSRSVTDRLEWQFILSMQAQIRRSEGADREELYSILEEALSLTVPMPWENSLEGRILSLDKAETARYHNITNFSREVLSCKHDDTKKIGGSKYDQSKKINCGYVGECIGAGFCRDGTCGRKCSAKTRTYACLYCC